MSIGGGMDLIREPRNGRNFEYSSEDPILAGTMVGSSPRRAVQPHHGRHQALRLNDQETGRNTLNASLDERAMRETDLLAFQIAIGIAHPAGVMCSYNHVNGDYACENDYTLNQVLKHDLGLQGLRPLRLGRHALHRQGRARRPRHGPARRRQLLQRAAEGRRPRGQVPQARLDDMVHRIVRSMFAAGVIDHPPIRSVVDPFRGRDDAQKIEEESIVLLKNTGGTLPLSAARVRSIASSAAMPTSASSPAAAPPRSTPPAATPSTPPGSSVWGKAVYFPSVPLRYIKASSARRTVTYDPGTDNAAAAKAAASAQLAIVFVTQWMSEGQDSATLSLPDKQDALVAAVAAANPNTIVVLENGGPVNMPWAAKRQSHPRVLVPRHRRRRRPSPTSSSAASTPPASSPSPSPPPKTSSPTPTSPASPNAPATTAPTSPQPARQSPPATSPSTTTSKAWPSATAGSRRRTSSRSSPSASASATPASPTRT
jgi:beta-glucosidase